MAMTNRAGPAQPPARVVPGVRTRPPPGLLTDEGIRVLREASRRLNPRLEGTGPLTARYRAGAAEHCRKHRDIVFSLLEKREAIARVDALAAMMAELRRAVFAAYDLTE